MQRAAWVLLLLAGTVAFEARGAVGQEIPPDTVSTVYVSDTIPSYGAVGGVVADGLGFIYIADFQNAVWRVSPDGTVDKFADGLYGASGNAIGPHGYLYQSSFNGNYVATTCPAFHVRETWRPMQTRASQGPWASRRMPTASSSS